MKLAYRTSFFIAALATFTGLAACSSDADPSPSEEDSTDSIEADIKKGLACTAKAPINAKCAAACPAGFQIVNGKSSCACCTPKPPPVATETCGNPPPTARCKACPGSGTYKQIDGRPSCECCSY